MNINKKLNTRNDKLIIIKKNKDESENKIKIKYIHKIKYK